MQLNPNGATANGGSYSPRNCGDTEGLGLPSLLVTCKGFDNIGLMKRIFH